MSESEFKKLNDLRVIDLRSELEKRGLETKGIKAILLNRLQKVSTIAKEGKKRAMLFGASHCYLWYGLMWFSCIFKGGVCLIT